MGEGLGEGREFMIDLINVQGLTDLKAYEIGKLLEGRKHRIIGLVETHEKYKRVDWMDGVKEIAQRREMSDKKGGGLLLLTRDGDDIKLEKAEEDCKDILVGNVSVGGWELKLVLTYLDIADIDRNRTG